MSERLMAHQQQLVPVADHPLRQKKPVQDGIAPIERRLRQDHEHAHEHNGQWLDRIGEQGSEAQIGEKTKQRRDRYVGQRMPEVCANDALVFQGIVPGNVVAHRQGSDGR